MTYKSFGLSFENNYNGPTPLLHTLGIIDFIRKKVEQHQRVDNMFQQAI
jgi:hypothetical protein